MEAGGANVGNLCHPAGSSSSPFQLFIRQTRGLLVKQLHVERRAPCNAFCSLFLTISLIVLALIAVFWIVSTSSVGCKTKHPEKCPVFVDTPVQTLRTVMKDKKLLFWPDNSQARHVLGRLMVNSSGVCASHCSDGSSALSISLAVSAVTCHRHRSRSICGPLH